MDWHNPLFAYIPFYTVQQLEKTAPLRISVSTVCLNKTCQPEMRRLIG